MIIVIILIVIFLLIAIKYGSAEDRFYLGPEWWKNLVEGTKTMDIRRGPLEKYKSLNGKTVVYQGKEQLVNVKITDMKFHDKWDDLKDDYKKISPDVKSWEEFLSKMKEWIDIKETGGVTVFTIEMVGKPKDKVKSGQKELKKKLKKKTDKKKLKKSKK